MKIFGFIVLVLATVFPRTTFSKVLFAPGQEYTYTYETLVTAGTGTEVPPNYASAYKLLGKLRIQAEDETTLNVKLDDLTVGLYNGPWTYFPSPSFGSVSSADLRPLAEPFRIQLDNGKFKGLILNDQEAHWSSNMKRGIATYLQMDLSVANFDRIGLQSVPEVTAMGECPTRYEILPASTNKFGMASLSKFRNHADCPDIATRTRHSTSSAYECRDKHTQNTVNSTAYATYIIDDSQADQVTVRSLVVYSIVLYWPFTNKAPYLYTWYSMTLTLVNVGAISEPIQRIENPKTQEELGFVFEQSDPSDPQEGLPDFKYAEPLFFHHSKVENDAEMLQGIKNQLHQTISVVADSLLRGGKSYESGEKLHLGSPIAMNPLTMSLDFGSLKDSYLHYSNAQAGGGQKAVLEFQLFLDALVMAGTGSALLTIRDILLTTTDTKVLGRFASSFPQNIAYPSEALAKELDPILDLTRKSSLSKGIRRMLELAMATAISKCCRRTQCTATGLLEKYVGHFEEKLRSDSFETQTVGILGLRNLGTGRALDILLAIATGKTVVPRSVRVQAIWGIQPLAAQNKDDLFNQILPVFYNRSEPCEIRTSAFSFLMTCQPDERIIHEIAYFMWTETCQQTANLVRATLINLTRSKNPCTGSQYYAQTILKYLPPGEVDPTRTTSYVLDYYDARHGFGHSVVLSLQKSTTSVLPVSVYLGLTGVIGGFASGYVGVYIRLEGVGKAVALQLANLRSANIEEIQRILSQVGVTRRESTPLKVELIGIFQGKVFAYYAADDQTVESFPSFVKRLRELAGSPTFDWERAFLLSGTVHQRPMEIGVPIDISTVIAGHGLLSYNLTRSGSTGTLAFGTQSRLGGSMYGLTRVSNHFPGARTASSVTFLRALRTNVVREMSLRFGRNQQVTISFKPPAEEDPTFAATHAFTYTKVSGDVYGAARDAYTNELLRQTCPSCQPITTVSKGKEFRKTKEIVLRGGPIKGVKATAGYFDCERDMSTSALLRRAQLLILNPDITNNRIFETATKNGILTFLQLRDHVFISPGPDACGLHVKFSRDSSGEHEALEEVEASFKGSVVPSTSTNSEFEVDLSLLIAFKYPTAPSVSVSTFITALSSLDTQKSQISIKGLLAEDKSDEGKVFCLLWNRTESVLPQDPLSYVGGNAPFIRGKGQLMLGSVPAAELRGKDTSCSDSHASLLVQAEATQSLEQVAESEQDVFPYKNCREQQSSPLYPGGFVPSTHECFLAAMEQTNLRRINVSISYELSPNVRRRLTRPLGLLEGLILPYHVDNENFISNHTLNADIHSSAGGKESGEIAIGLNVKKQEPLADVHYHTSAGREGHFHGIDLSLLPSFLRPEPVSSRFPKLMTLGLRIGAFGICRINPNVLNTFDNVVLPEVLPECLTLLSADCGETPRFAILGKRTSSSSIALELHIGKNRIELDEGGVRINGNGLELPNLVQVDLRSPSAATFKALRNGAETYIFSRANGVFVRYTVSSATISLDARYRGLQCGACGAWDSMPGNDLTGPDLGCAHKLRPREFLDSWVLREGSCSSVGQICPAADGS